LRAVKDSDDLNSIGSRTIEGDIASNDKVSTVSEEIGARRPGFRLRRKSSRRGFDLHDHSIGGLFASTLLVNLVVDSFDIANRGGRVSTVIRHGRSQPRVAPAFA